MLQGITGQGWPWFDTRSTMKGIFDLNLRPQARAQTQMESQNVCITNIDVRYLKELLVAIFKLKVHTAKLGVQLAHGYDVYVALVKEAGRK
jgi:hypothetical protein